jgi:hypothetical protein
MTNQTDNWKCRERGCGAEHVVYKDHVDHLVKVHGLLGGRVTSPPKISFHCRVCGKVCDCAGPDGAICPECCGPSEDGHEYVYSRDERTHYCTHCGQNPPSDWYDDIELDSLER